MLDDVHVIVLNVVKVSMAKRANDFFRYNTMCGNVGPVNEAPVLDYSCLGMLCSNLLRGKGGFARGTHVGNHKRVDMDKCFHMFSSRMLVCHEGLLTLKCSGADGVVVFSQTTSITKTLRNTGISHCFKLLKS